MEDIAITNWNEFTEFIEKASWKYQDIEIGHCQFRGQSDKKWKLEPSLSRIVNGDENSEKKARYFEQQATMEFRTKVHLLNDKIVYNSESSPIATLMDMQHYSCPTRLLDWSTSPYVALYFAVNDNLDKNGALFVWDIPYYKNKLKKIYGETSVGFNELLDFTKYDLVEIVYSTRKNERIVKQQGTFSISNNILKSHCDLINEITSELEKNSGLYKLEIHKDLKLEFLARLKTMNISPESLFPGLDGLGQSIKESLILRKWLKK